MTDAELEHIDGALALGMEAEARKGTLAQARTVMSVVQARRLVAGCRRLNAIERTLGPNMLEAVDLETERLDALARKAD